MTESKVKEVKRPMAVKEPSDKERIEAMEIRIAELEKEVENHHRYHFGGMG